MLHVGCGLTGGEREKKEEEKKKIEREREWNRKNGNRIMYIEPCLPTCFFFSLVL